MICLKTRTFAVSQTTIQVVRRGYYSCDLLENSYFCSIANNTNTAHERKRRVVICLKTRTFAVSQTTRVSFARTCLGCDLLENSYFCSIANNRNYAMVLALFVVICLKTRTFAVSQTTLDWTFALPVELWFAWKLVLLQYRKQLSTRVELYRLGCDLLENSYFCSIANNSPLHMFIHLMLWFAWKLVLLQYRKQPEFGSYSNQLGCDLLENSYFCSIANNEPFSRME